MIILLTVLLLAGSAISQSCATTTTGHLTAGVSSVANSTPGCDEISGPLSFSFPRVPFLSMAEPPVPGGSATFTIWNGPGQDYTVGGVAIGFFRVVFPSPYVPGVNIPGTSDPNCINHVGPFNNADFGFAFNTWLNPPGNCFHITIEQMIPPDIVGFPIGAQAHLSELLEITPGNFELRRWASNPVQIVVQPEARRR